jgi:hypothetical protein
VVRRRAARDGKNAQSLTPWADYRKWTENGELFLLYQSDRLFQMMPKRAFASAEDMRELRDFLVAAGVRKAGFIRWSDA